MNPGVQLRDGVEVTLANGETICFDGDHATAQTVVSHAHGDHLVETADPLVASPLTAALAGVRQETAPDRTTHPAIDLYNAGHIAGSRAALVTDPDTGRRYLYTGDCCLRDRFYLDGFEPPSADVLIVETTYGTPEYTFPPTDEVVARIRDWLTETADEVVLLFGYALGRAQKLQRIVAETGRDIYITDAIDRLNTVIANHRDVTFPEQIYTEATTLHPGDVLILPMQTTRLAWISSLVEQHDAVTAGFSGWAIDESFVYRRGLDRGFVLSDHCDFDELIELVGAVDPEKVYTCHGATESFASHLTSEYGYQAQALKEHQSTLTDF